MSNILHFSSKNEISIVSGQSTVVSFLHGDGAGGHNHIMACYRLSDTNSHCRGLSWMWCIMGDLSSSTCVPWPSTLPDISVWNVSIQDQAEFQRGSLGDMCHNSDSTTNGSLVVGLLFCHCFLSWPSHININYCDCLSFDHNHILP